MVFVITALIVVFVTGIFVWLFKYSTITGDHLAGILRGPPDWFDAALQQPEIEPTQPPWRLRAPLPCYKPPTVVATTQKFWPPEDHTIVDREEWLARADARGGTIRVFLTHEQAYGMDRGALAGYYRQLYRGAACRDR